MKILLFPLFIVTFFISCRQEREIRKLTKLKTVDLNVIETSKIKFDGSYVLSSAVNNKDHYSENKPNFCVFTFYKDSEFKRSANYYVSDYTRIDSLELSNKRFYNVMRNKEIKSIYNVIKSDSIVLYELYKNTRKKHKTEYSIATYSLNIISDTIYISENNNLLLDKMKLFYAPNIRQNK